MENEKVSTTAQNENQSAFGTKSKSWHILYLALAAQLHATIAEECTKGILIHTCVLPNLLYTRCNNNANKARGWLSQRIK
jgi:hypothetical protein